MALHNHSYSRKPGEDTSNSSPEATQHAPAPAICPLNHTEMREKCLIVKEGLQVSSHLRWQIEEDTRLQLHSMKLDRKGLQGISVGRF